MIAVASVVWLLAACDDPASETAAEPTPVGGEAACANQAEVIGDQETMLGDPVEVDVVGDGVGDEVTLHFDRDAAVGCQAFLVVGSEDDLVAPVWTMGEPSGLPQPSIFGFSDLDGDGGFEIVISEASGASTQFVNAYKVAEGRIVSLHVPDSDTGLFAFGGSVGHIEAIDCSPDGEILVSQAVPGEGHAASEQPLYEVTRRTYRVEGAELTRVDVERREMPIDRLVKFEEFGSGPFASCPAP